MFLNEKKQALFRFEVVIETCERHASGAREIAHGGTFVSFFAEDFGGVIEDVSETAIESGVGRRIRRPWAQLMAGSRWSI
jgi:hypothetical protein